MKWVMRMFNSLLPWMNTSIKVELATALDAYGSPLWLTPIDLKCYPEYKSQVILNLTGDKVISNIHLYAPGSISRPLYGKITLDDTEYMLKGIDEYHGPSGKVECQVMHL